MLKSIIDLWTLPRVADVGSRGIGMTSTTSDFIRILRNNQLEALALWVVYLDNSHIDSNEVLLDQHIATSFVFFRKWT